MRWFKALILLLLQLWGNVIVSLSQNDCSTLPIVPHAFVSEETKRAEYPQGHVIHFTCETGYVSGPLIRYICTNEGWFSRHDGPCVLKPCELPGDTPNGYYEIIKGEDFVFGATIRYFCNRGYQMVSKEDTRTCLVDHWTNHLPICQPVSCDPPPDDERMTITGFSGTQDPILPDRFLRFSCDVPGTYLKGSSELICGQDGQWDHAFPTCEEITCTVDMIPPHLRVIGLPKANKTMKTGHTLRFDCDDQRSLEGPAEITCLVSGEWNRPFPKCAGRCRLTGVPEGISIKTRISAHQLIRPGQQIEFTCPNNRLGHVLLGNKSVECLSDGQWSSPFPTCGPPAGCGRPPLLEDGDTKFNAKAQYRHGDQVEYMCVNLHTMRGGPFKTCNNGEWTGSMRCLKPCTVDRDLMSKYNIEFQYVDESKLYAPHLDGITFGCSAGRRPVGTMNMRQVCHDGVMNLPRCV